MENVYYASRHLHDTAHQWYTDYWFPVSKLFQLDSLRCALSSRKSYTNLRQSIISLFQSQQLRFGHAINSTIICQLYAFHRFQELFLGKIGKVMLQLSLLPTMMELNRVNNPYGNAQALLDEFPFSQSYLDRDQYMLGVECLLGAIVQLMGKRLKFDAVYCILRYTICDPMDFLALASRRNINRNHKQDSVQTVNMGETNEIHETKESSESTVTESTTRNDTYGGIYYNNMAEHIDDAIEKVLHMSTRINSWSGFQVTDNRKEAVLTEPIEGDDVDASTSANNTTISETNENMDLKKLKKERLRQAILVRLDHHIFQNLYFVALCLWKETYYAKSYKAMSKLLQWKHEFICRLPLDATNDTSDENVDDEETIRNYARKRHMALIDTVLKYPYRSLAIRRQMIDNKGECYEYHNMHEGRLIKRELSFGYDTICEHLDKYLQEFYIIRGKETRLKQLIAERGERGEENQEDIDTIIKDIEESLPINRKFVQMYEDCTTSLLTEVLPIKEEVSLYAATKDLPTEVTYYPPLLTYFSLLHQHGDANLNDAMISEKMIYKMKDGFSYSNHYDCSKVLLFFRYESSAEQIEHHLFSCQTRLKGSNALKKAFDLYSQHDYNDIVVSKIQFYQLLAEVYQTLVTQPENSFALTHLIDNVKDVDQLVHDWENTYIDATSSNVWLEWKRRLIRMRLCVIMLVVVLKVNIPELCEMPTLRSFRNKSNAERIKHIYKEVVSMAYHMVKHMLDIVEAVLKLDPNNDAISNLLNMSERPSYWHFLSNYMFWIEKALEGIVMHWIEESQLYPNCRIIIHISDEDQDRTFAPLGLITDKVIDKDSCNVVLDITYYFEQSLPNAEDMMKFLATAVGEWEVDYPAEEVGKLNMSKWPAFINEQSSATRILGEVANRWLQQCEDAVKVECMKDIRNRSNVNKTRAKTVFFTRK